MSLDMLGIGSIIEGVGKVAKEMPKIKIKLSVRPEPVEGLAAPLIVITTSSPRMKIALQEKSIETDLVKSQMEIDKTEAQHTSVFVCPLSLRGRVMPICSTRTCAMTFGR